MEKEEIVSLVREVMHGEFGQFLKDIEFRVSQAYEVSRRTAGEFGSVFAEDINLAMHTLTGYTITNNSPTAGFVAWASLHVVYNGTDNAITDGNSNDRYIWWDPAVSSTTLQVSNTQPTLSSTAALIFVNNSGTATVAVGATVPPAVGAAAVNAAAIITGAVGSAALASGAVTSTALASGAVTSSAIASGAVGSSQIASGAVGNTQLGSAAVQSGNIASGAVGSSALASGAVTSAALGAGAVGATNLNILAHILY